MTLRARLALLTTIAVAIAIVAASISIWLLIRWSLLDEVDQQLLGRMNNVNMIAREVEEMPTERFTADPEGSVQLALQNDPLGVQVISTSGDVLRTLAPGDIVFPFSEEELELLNDEPGDVPLRTVTLEEESYRVISARLEGGEMLRLIYPLAGVEQTMSRIAWLLIGVASTGIVVAGGLGWVTARTGLRPVDHLVQAAEQVATTRDLAHRIEVSGNTHDEIGRLANSLNEMLSALESARIQQRELVENASHELRTPLATLRNDLGLLMRAEQHSDRSLDPRQRARLMEDLESEIAALTDLVAEIVDLARGGLEPESPEEANLRSLVNRAVVRTQKINPEVNVTVEGAGFEATVRPETLERAITNLLRNALQVSPTGGTVEVNLREDDGHAVVTVRDRGPGVAIHDIPRIFDRFYRGEGARERQGSGLGLAIVAQVAELHRGHIDVENRQGGGAIFTLRIPINSKS